MENRKEEEETKKATKTKQVDFEFHRRRKGPQALLVKKKKNVKRTPLLNRGAFDSGIFSFSNAQTKQQ